MAEPLDLVDELIAARKRLGFTQRDVADMIGVSQPYISNIERRMVSPRLSVIRRYAREVNLKLHTMVAPDE